MSIHNMFLWRSKKKIPRIMAKYSSFGHNSGIILYIEGTSNEYPQHMFLGGKKEKIPDLSPNNTCTP